MGFGAKWTFRSPKDVVDEIAYLHGRGVKGFLFRDQSFSMDKKRASKICEEIISRRLEIAWFCEARVDQVSKDMLKLMKRAGCKQIHFGVETGDSELIKWGKPYTDLNSIRKAFQMTKELNLFSMAHIIFGWPDESLKTMENTCKFLLEIAPDSVNWNFLTPYPGTKLYNIAKENNLFLTNDWSDFTSHTVVLKTKWLSNKQLKKRSKEIANTYSRHRLLGLFLNIRKKRGLLINKLEQIIGSYFAA
jgi:radical SAM superfamily enzyme YgiQ (UPF0313 family)